MKILSLSLKRMLDVFCAGIGCIALLPLFILITILVKCSSPGPAFFIQERPGYQGKTFRVIKFRSMKLGSEHMVKGQEVLLSDTRITTVGRFLRRSKMDEIPQLFNVIKGEMSLVGPRPERIESMENYDEEISKRLVMRPGLTGLAQVSGNIYLTLENRYSYDVYYVEHYSLGLDIRILLRTIAVIFVGEDMYLNNPLVTIPVVQRSLQE